MAKEKKKKVMPREDGLTDYDIYIMSKRELVFYSLCGMAVMFVIGYLFYKSWLLSFILMFTGCLFPKIRTRQIITQRRNNLTIQFKDLLYSLSSAISVGKSLETGLKDALTDLKVIYPDHNTDIIREVEYIVRGLSMSETLETMFSQFAERTHVEDITSFVDVFVTCKRTGGDLMEVIRSTSNTIGDKIETKMEIQMMVGEKKTEFRVLMVMPVAMIFVLTYTAGDYMAPVFTTIAGRIAMTVAIIMFALAYKVGSKIMKIEI